MGKSQYDLFITDPHLVPSWIETVSGTFQEATEHMRTRALRSPGRYFLFKDFTVVASIGESCSQPCTSSQDRTIRAGGGAQ